MRRLTPLLMIAAMLFLSQCSSDDGTGPPPPNDETAGTQIATEAFEDLGTALEDMSAMTADELRDVKFDDLRAGFENALDKDADNAIAHLGLSIVELLELNYSPQIWDVIDSFDSWLYGSPAPPGRAPSRQRTLIGRQFSLMVEAPLAVNVRAATSFPPTLTFDRIQQVIGNVILPGLRRAMNHLAIAESHINARLRLRIESEGVVEYVVIDLGEIYVFDASLRALAAGFGMAIARDIDLFGPDGTYGWIDDMEAFSDAYPGGGRCAVSSVETPATPYDSLDLYYVSGYESTHQDSLLIRVLYHNLESRSAFLALRDNGAHLREARLNLLGTLEKLEAGVDFIRNVRDDETEENVIKLTDLTDIDAGLGGPDVPNFAKSFTKIEDVVEFVRSLLTEVVYFSEELGPDRVLFEWHMNLGRQFTNPEPGLKTLLPYHKWDLPVGNWIAAAEDDWSWDNGGYDYYTDVWNGTYCDWHYWSQIGVVTEHWREYSLDPSLEEPILLLDGPDGDPIDMSVERMPYFPDYTFNGLFPDMATRQRWLDLIDILEPSPVAPPSPRTTVSWR